MAKLRNYKYKGYTIQFDKTEEGVCATIGGDMVRCTMQHTKDDALRVAMKQIDKRGPKNPIANSGNMDYYARMGNRRGGIL
jgi:hypothetical protein